MTLNVKLTYRPRNRRWQSREERDLLAESSEDLSVCLHYYFYTVDNDILEAIKSASRTRRKNMKKRIITWTRDSGRLILRATSSRIKMSGYLVFENSPSNTSSWALVKVVLSRRCLRWFIPATWRKERSLLIITFINLSEKFSFGMYLIRITTLRSQNYSTQRSKGVIKKFSQLPNRFQSIKSELRLIAHFGWISLSTLTVFLLPLVS